MIPGLSLAFIAVFNGLNRAVVDAGHAMGAVSAPQGFAVLQGDVAQRAEGGTAAAARAFFPCRKGLILHAQGIKQRIHGAAHDLVIQ